MNRVEIWFGTLNRRLLRWGCFTSTDDLEDSIRRFVTQYNDVWAHPYKWTYTTTCPTDRRVPSLRPSETGP